MNDILKGWASEEPVTQEDIDSAEEDLAYWERRLVEMNQDTQDVIGSVLKAEQYRDTLKARLKEQHGDVSN
ncbi:hypothetical protein [Bradyrhizobium sp. AUGA SZCCT0431]|uniref:hypothetical protein n=1 Tax=Bradyrhizobium sp. AUGA SZCCT0431 TaxID=2807674 RepID=UPI001BAE3D85|nr:hypothetical protein [Bradyrhizobium sp. AUGA SZCCT0431]MBR1146660.1 hypothetical protein [Bradyrhizobium sp. AUGA SZCCT0431]